MVEIRSVMSLRFFRNFILLAIVVGVACYVLRQYNVLPSSKKTPEVTVYNPDEEAPSATQGEEVSSKSVMEALLPGATLPQQFSSLSTGKTWEITSGAAAVYHPSSIDPTRAATRWELSPEAEHILISKRAEGLYAVTLVAANGGENKTLALLRAEGTTLRSIEDDQGESIALLLPLSPKNQVLLMPDVKCTLPLSTEGLAVSDLPEELPKTARVTTEMLNSTEFELRFVSPEKIAPLADALHGKAFFTLADTLQLPTLVSKNNLMLERRPGASSSLPGLDLLLPLSGRAAGMLTLFSPQLTLDWDFRDEVLAHVMRMANAPHGAKGKAADVRRKYSIAHVYHLLSHIPTAKSTGEKNKLAEKYFELFLDPDFRRFCEKHMSYLPIPDSASISKEGGKLVIQDGTMRQLLRFDMRSLQFSMNDALTQAAKEAYTTCRNRFCAMPIPPLAIHLVSILVSPDLDEDQISWSFSLESL